MKSRQVQVENVSTLSESGPGNKSRLTEAQSAVGVDSAAHDVGVYAPSAAGDDHSAEAGGPYSAVPAPGAS